MKIVLVRHGNPPTSMELASAKHPVWLVGHGILNGLIAGELRRAGWRGPRRRPTRYWVDVVFERPAA